MAKKHIFKNLAQALRWRKHHKKEHVTGVVVTSNRAHRVPTNVTSTTRANIVSMAHRSLAFAGQMPYTMTSLRSQLFHRSKGNFAGAHADCSQFFASILHWFGVKGVTDSDWTGTLWDKGKVLSSPKPGCGVIFGPHPGEHIAMITEQDDRGVWWAIGFGHTGAPDRVSLPDLKAYFSKRGHPGVRYIDLIP